VAIEVPINLAVGDRRGDGIQAWGLD